MKYMLVGIVLLIITFQLPLVAVSQDVLVITPDFIIQNTNGYYISFVDNITVTSLEWLPGNWLRFNNLQLHNEVPETLEIYFTGCNITIEKFYELYYMIVAKLYINESYAEIIIKTEDMPRSIFLNGKVVPQYGSLISYEEAGWHAWYYDSLTKKLYIRIYKTSSASLSTLFPKTTTEPVTLAIVTGLYGEVKVTTTSVVPFSLIILTLVLTITTIIVIRRNKIHINNFLRKLSYEVKK